MRKLGVLEQLIELNLPNEIVFINDERMKWSKAKKVIAKLSKADGPIKIEYPNAKEIYKL